MNVTCPTWDEMKAALILVEKVFDDTVFVSLSKKVTGSASQEITFQVSTVVQATDGGEYILQFGKMTGVDWLDGDADLAGSEEADRIRQELKDICQERSWKQMPGIISE